MPWGLMECQDARFSPEPRCSPSWYTDHLPSRVVHATQMWCQALSFRLSGSWATFERRARSQCSIGSPPLGSGAPGSPQPLAEQAVQPKIYRHPDVLLLALKTHPNEPPSSSSCLPPQT